MAFSCRKHGFDTVTGISCPLCAQEMNRAQSVVDPKVTPLEKISMSEMWREIEHAAGVIMGSSTEGFHLAPDGNGNGLRATFVVKGNVFRRGFLQGMLKLALEKQAELEIHGTQADYVEARLTVRTLRIES